LVHRAMTELDAAQLAGGGLLGGAHGIARDAPAHLLKADRRVRNDAAAALGAACDRELAQNVVLHEGKKLVQALVLVMVRIDVDDQDIVELSLLRLLAGVGKQPGGVELFNCDTPAAVDDEVHGASPDGDSEN